MILCQKVGDNVSLRQYSLFTDDGELISTTLTKKPRLAGDWVVFYKGQLKKLAESNVEASTLRVYLWLASKQTFENYVMTTRKTIAEKLNLSKITVHRAINWLIENQYLIEAKVEGNVGYLLNPDVTTKGAKNKAERKGLWETIKRIAIEKGDLNGKSVDQ